VCVCVCVCVWCVCVCVCVCVHIPRWRVRDNEKGAKGTSGREKGGRETERDLARP
jgi:hypothetical protein